MLKQCTGTNVENAFATLTPDLNTLINENKLTKQSSLQNRRKIVCRSCAPLLQYHGITKHLRLPVDDL